MRDAYITGIGTYLPELMHTNDTLPPLDKPVGPEKLERIGVVRRGWASEREGIAEMAAAAARQALDQAQLEADSLDLIILANWTQRRYIPEFAPKLQKLLGAKRAFAFEVCGACAGFVNGVGIAHNFFQNPRYERALVVGSETTSRRGRPHSLSTLIFGDGAGAFVLERDAGRGGRVIDTELISDGDYCDVMDISEEGWVRTHITQKELNTLAAQSFARASHGVLARNQMTLDDVDWIVPHSGTAGVQATLVRTLEVPAEKVLSNFSTVGNLSSAAIPVSLADYIGRGVIQKGQTVLSPTTGTGWYCAAMLYTV